MHSTVAVLQDLPRIDVKLVTRVSVLARYILHFLTLIIKGHPNFDMRFDIILFCRRKRV